jgi:hypothetical protein
MKLKNKLQKEEQKMKRKMIRGLFGMFMLVVMAAIAIADADAPYGPDTITTIRSERGNLTGTTAKDASAQGGNVTELQINTTVLTKRWQGYFGNLTGEISLQDAAGNTFYSWPQGDISTVGEVYAANVTVSNWRAVKCVNGSPNGRGFNCTAESESCLNISSIEATFGFNPTDKDGVNETFAFTEQIIVGSRTLNCPATYVFTSGGQTAGSWNETLLTVNNTNDTLIFASEVMTNGVGYDGNNWDFQIMVLDNGNVEAPTNYKFYVELI